MDSPERDPPRTHPHPAPPSRERLPGEHDVVVVGGGHAGIEAALAAVRLGCRAALVTQRADLIGEMSCNPAIGGLGKGQLAREVDALGGAMGHLADATGIQFRVLNTSKGHAVRAPRAQSDRHLYRERATALVAGTPGLEIIEGEADSLWLEEGPVDHLPGRRRGARGAHVRGLVLADGRRLPARAVVLATGTFLRAIMHTGERTSSGGRIGEGTSTGLARSLDLLGLELARLKTGTPPRLAREGIRWEALEEQRGDARPVPFSFATDLERFPVLPQVACHVTWTNELTHRRIRENIDRAPMYSGRIRGVGPRYCPSVEDKVMRFPERERHQVFLEPEGLETDVIYVNGVSTSMPADVQEAFVHTIEGLEEARFLRHGYAVEYDVVRPAQLGDTLAVSGVPGLYLAGQVNGTSGYEEAAGQGLMAGANAALWASDRAPLVLGRHEAYVGVMVDDLVTSAPSEPYRMFTSRAEYRLLLRHDNADRRLTRRAHALGLADDAALARLDAREERIGGALELLGRLRAPGRPDRDLAAHLRRPDVTWSVLVRDFPEVVALDLDAADSLAVEVEVKYEGYIERERLRVERLRRQEHLEIPADLDLAALRGLAHEAREKLVALRPRTVGSAARIDGVRPPDVALLALHVERHLRR